MNKQELIKKINEIATETPFPNAKIVDHSEVIKLIEQLDEPQKPVVPQFVADWIEKNRGSLFGLNYDSVSSEIYDWVYEEEEEGNLKKLHLACAIGYTVEKEKRYYVRLKGVVDNLRLLRHNSPTNTWTIGSEEQCFNVSRAHTRKQLEEAGFGWVLDCPGIEIEEVKE